MEHPKSAPQTMPTLSRTCQESIEKKERQRFDEREEGWPVKHGVLHDELGLPELRVDNKFACLCGHGFESLELLGEHLRGKKDDVREPGPHGELDALLNRLLDAERQIIHYQQVSANVRQQIHDRFGELERSMVEMQKTRLTDQDRR